MDTESTQVLSTETTGTATISDIDAHTDTPIDTPIDAATHAATDVDAAVDTGVDTGVDAGVGPGVGPGVGDIDEVALTAKKAHLLETIRAAGHLIVAYSGGVDSSLLAYYARLVLGEKAKIVIAVSPSLAQSELDSARRQAQQFKWELIEIATDEVDKAEYQRNDEMRCYHCKSTLFSKLSEMAQRLNINDIAYGANMDDLKDFRPGHKAAREFRVLSPLQVARLGKEEIRFLARQAALPSWNRPQAACLSSRFPTFQPVTVSLLSQVERAEDYLRSLGFKQIRVRHYDEIARIEVEKSELSRILEDSAMHQQIVTELKRLGYRHVTVDPEGYKQGSANQLKQSDGGSDVGKAET